MSVLNSMQSLSNRLISMCAAFYLLITAAFLSNSAFAEPAFQFHTLDKQDGMISSVVYDIAQDNDGFMWFATEDGLVKYDGFEFINYRHSRLDKNSLSDNVVRVLLFDRLGRLWVGTDGGLNLYQREFDNFKSIQLTNVESEKIKANQIRELHQSSDGVVWVGTGNGLSSIDKSLEDVKSFPQAKVRAIYEDDRKQLWVGTLGAGLYKFDRNLSKFFHVSGKVTKSGNRPELSSKIIDIYQDAFGRTLVATWGAGVFKLHRSELQMSEYEISLPSLNVRNIHQDEKNNLWFATDKGLVIQDATENTTRLVESDSAISTSIASNLIYKVFQSRDKTVWVGTRGGGVGKHYPSSRIFETYGKNDDISKGLKDPVIFAMGEADDGSIWLGTEMGELVRFNASERNFQHVKLKLNGSYFEDPISAIVCLDKSHLLIGGTSGLYLFNILDSSLKEYEIEGSKDHSVGFIKKTSDNQILLGLKSSGIVVASSDQLVSNNLESLPKIELFSSKAIYEKSVSEFIIGTDALGAFIVRVKGEGNFETELIPGTEGFQITDVAIDSKENIWLSTLANGILIVGQSGKITNLDEDTGLINNTVYTILFDSNSSKVWATTNLGLVAIDPISFSSVHFRHKDGLQGDEFNSAKLMAKNGYLYIAGTQGFSRFFPSLLSDKTYVEPPIVSELRIANDLQQISEGNKSILHRSLVVQKKLKLDYEHTPFSLKYTSPQFRSSDKLEFRYRLNGIHENWITSPASSRVATYTNVGAGDYEFELQVRQLNGDWLNAMTTKTIIVNSPWWFNTLAKLIYSLLIGTLLSLFTILIWQKRKAEILTQKTVEESEKRLRLSLWGGGNEIWDWNIRSGEVLRSDADKNININCSKLSRNLKELSTYIHKYDIDRVRLALNEHLSGKTDSFEATYRIQDDKLEWRWIQDRAKVVERDENNLPVRMSGTQKDVSEIHRKDEEIERLGQAFRTTSDGVWIRDAKWRLIECNPSYEKITGFSFAEKKGEELWFPDVTEQSVNIIQRIRLSLMEKGNWQGEVWAERKDGDPFPQKLTVDTILDEKGYVRYYVGVFSDITFHKRAEEEFRKLANFDALTGLPNRACLYDRLNQTIEKTRIRRERFAIFVIDIDNFKRVNDSLGHNVGDMLINEVAQRLTSRNRDGDTIARVGGDEFVIIRDDIQSSTEVASFAELMLKELNEPVYIKGQKLNLNFSIGITISPDDGITAEKLLRNADTAMYEAKKEVLNSYHFYSVELNDKARKKLAMENELRRAIERGEIDLAYQPKVDLNTGRICGMEALARWSHPKFGIVSPDDFIHLAEETGLIQPLGHQLLRKAVRQTKLWVESGKMRGRMSVNLSAHQFWHRDLTSEVMSILEQESLDPKHLELELTESVCVQEIDQTIIQMQELRELGINLALDDFGTGYSSLAQLKTLPLNVLKVDKSFIQNVESSKQDGNIVKAIIDIASNLELDVVIEGVETKDQCDHLWKSKARIIQGYFFSRPVKHLELESMLSKKWETSEYLNDIVDNVTNFSA
jgi:diguanylate cyclase (GGDEF)-like protein/PAS domain S-box-containing protein